MDCLPLRTKMAARRSYYLAGRIHGKVRGISSSASVRSAQSSGDPNVLAIRREEYTVWERRAPLNPQHVQSLVRDGYKVIIQPSARRAYTMAEYAAAGAVFQEDIEEAGAILGVKTMPTEKIIPNRTYSIFSHTIKAQKAQMPLLDAFVEKGVRLIDYEKFLDAKGRRLVAFGQYAGIAGMVNILHGLGLRLLVLGYHTPFVHIGNAHNYSSSSAAKAAVNQLGREIQLGLIPEALGPIVFTFTGKGNVAQGAQNVFQELPNEYVAPSDLPEVVELGDMRKVYGTVVSKEDYLEHKDGRKFDAAEFDAHPEKYRSSFAEKIAPFTTVLINGIYWQPGYPRLLTANDMLTIQPKTYVTDPNTGAPKLPQRLLAVCDISADIEGSIEFLSEYTSIDSPFMMYDAHKNAVTHGEVVGNGVLVMSIDHLPAQLPREATDYFGTQLLPFVKELGKLDGTKPLEEVDNVSNTVKDAVMTYGGSLTPKYQYITELRKGPHTAAI